MADKERLWQEILKVYETHKNLAEAGMGDLDAAHKAAWEELQKAKMELADATQDYLMQTWPFDSWRHWTTISGSVKPL